MCFTRSMGGYSRTMYMGYTTFHRRSSLYAGENFNSDSSDGKGQGEVSYQPIFQAKV